MDKYDFLASLKERLRSLPEDDAQKYIEYYSEMIDDRVEEGLSEEDAIREIGTPKEIAEQILGQIPETEEKDTAKQEAVPKSSNKAKGDKGNRGALFILLLILGAPLWIPLIIAVFSVIFSVFGAVFSVFISVLAVIFSVAVCGIAGILASPLVFAYSGAGAGLVIIGAGLLFAGGSVFLFRGFRLLVKGFIWFVKKFFTLIKSLFGKKEA